MAIEDNESKQKIADKDQKTVFDDIRKQLISLNESQRKSSDILKKQDVKDLKEKTQAKETQEDTPSSGGDEEKEMGALRKTFQKSFSSVKETFSPGGLLKGFGLLSGSPIFMLMGDKLDDLVSQYSEFRKENKEANAVQEEADKENFMAEDIRDKELELAEQQNELLEDILDKPSGDVEEKGGFLSKILGGITGIFSAILPKSLGKILPKLMGGGLGGLGGKAAGVAGKGMAVAAAGFAGWKMGTWINKNITEALGQPLGGWIYDMVHGGFQDWWKSMKDMFSGWMSEMGVIAIEIWDDFVAPFKDMGSWIGDKFTVATEAISDYFSSAGEIVTDLFDNLLDVFNFDKMKEKASEITEMIKEKINSFIEIITNPMELIKKGMSWLGDKLGFGPNEKEQEKIDARKGWTLEKDGNAFLNSHNKNTTLDNVEQTVSKQKQLSEDETNKQRKSENKQSNNIIQSSQNNIVVQDDMNTHIDDSYVTAAWF